MDTNALEKMTDMQLVFMRHEMIKTKEPKENIKKVDLELAKRHKKNCEASLNSQSR